MILPPIAPSICTDSSTTSMMTAFDTPHSIAAFLAGYHCAVQHGERGTLGAERAGKPRGEDQYAARQQPAEKLGRDAADARQALGQLRQKYHRCQRACKGSEIAPVKKAHIHHFLPSFLWSVKALKVADSMIRNLDLLFQHGNTSREVIVLAHFAC